VALSLAVDATRSAARRGTRRVTKSSRKHGSAFHTPLISAVSVTRLPATNARPISVSFLVLALPERRAPNHHEGAISGPRVLHDQ
jgi:hypothetical protein